MQMPSKIEEPLTEATFYILLSMAREPRHGYAILKEVQRLSSGNILLSTGTLYGAIKRLLDLEWIQRVEIETGENHRGKERRTYQLTGRGRRVLEAELARLKHLVRHGSTASFGRDAVNNRLRLASAVYGVVTGLYPRRFRQAFGSEMQAVFTDRALDAARQGGRQFLAVCLNELWDLPGSLLREYRAEHIERKAMMDKRAETGLFAEPQKPLAGGGATGGTWKDVFLAGLPYVLIALFVLDAGCI